MRWLRSWPLEFDEGQLQSRAHVIDSLPRLYTRDYDYTPLGEIDDDVIIVEWDIAVDPDDAEQFELMCKPHPYEPLVAAHKLYHIDPDLKYVWAHRKLRHDDRARWIGWHEPFCDYFAFGLIYLPRDLVRDFLAAPAPARGAPLVTPGGYTDTRFTDQTFSMWYRHRCESGGPVRVEWSVQPVHLHGRER